MTMKEVQDLEARCLLSVTPVADESLLTNCQTCVTASNTDPSLVQLNTVGMQEIVSGSVVSPTPLVYGVYGPTWMPGAVQAFPTSQTTAEDLYDEGAGAVWGSLSDEGGPIYCDGPIIPPYVPVDGGGILGIDVGGDMPIPDAGNAGADGTMGVGFCGVDDVGQDINGAGGVVWGTIADEGVYGGIDDVADYGAGVYGGLDDVADNGAAAIGGLDDVADYGAVIGSPADGGIDSGIGVNGIDGDYGAAGYGPGDYGIGADDYGIGAGAYGTNDTGAIGSPAGDYGAVDYGAGAHGAGDYGIGAGDYGTNDTGTIGAVEGDYGAGADDGTGVNGADGGQDPHTEVSIDTLEFQFYEGPYEERRLDRALLQILNVSLANHAYENATATLKFTGDAKYGSDYIVTTIDGLDAFGSDGNEITVALNSPNGLNQFYLVSLIDGDYELDESIKITIIGVSTNAKIGQRSDAESTLIDATGDLDIDNLNEDTEDKPGADVLRNDDDDNQNEIPDLLELKSGQENDLLPLTIKSYVRVDNDYFPNYTYGANTVETETYFLLTFDPILISVTYGHAPDFEIESGVTKIELSLGQSASLLVEGLGTGVGTITLRWVVKQKDGEQVYADLPFDTVKYTVWAVDLDANSDNTEGPLTAPDHSMWEDYIEDHTHGLGVIIYPDEYYNPPGQPNYPFNELQLATYSVTHSSWYDQEKQGISFDWQATGNSGNLKVFSMPGDVLGGLKKWSLESGGHEITQGRVYSSAELAVAAQDGRFVPGKIWLQGSSPNFPASKLNQFHSIDQNGKQDDFLEAVGYVDRDSGWDKIVTDRIKYLIATPNTFYPHLQWDIDPLPGQELPPIFEPGHAGRSDVLRDAVASGAVYTAGADKKEFALKLQDATDLLRLGVSPGIVSKIMAAGSSNSGLQLSVYRDYASVGAPVVLAFRGTDDAMDGLDNVFQGMGGTSFQYSDAIAIGAAVAAAPGVRAVGLRITGHSLGGGLASAALVAARAVDANSSAKLAYLHCNTFNAAGLHSNSLYVNNDPTQAQRVPGIRAAYDTEVARVGLIDAWYLHYDILSFVQDNARGMPKAIGRRHVMAGPKISPIDAQLIEELAEQIQLHFEGNSVDDLITFLHRSSPATGANFWDVKEILFNSHKTSFYYFGLMVIPNFDHPDNKDWWDIYGDASIHY